MTLVMTSTSTDFTTRFNPSIQLENDVKYEMALLNLTTYNSAPNIDDTNNYFRYSLDKEVTWQEIILQEGAYELQDMFDNMELRLADNAKVFKFYININTGYVEINCLDYEIVFDFSQVNSIGNILGFAKMKLTGENFYQSTEKVKIDAVNQYLVNCDIIKGSYLNGSTLPCLYTFMPQVPPGYKIHETPLVPVYMPITTSRIDEIRIWLTDQNGKMINLRDEEITIRLHVRKSVD
jgi:hypothetical protein